MRVNSIVIKNMNNVKQEEIQFQDANYLYGCNGCGKSTVLQAVQLALFGYIPGQPKTNSSIFSHCNGNMMKVSANIEIDCFGSCSITRTWTKVRDTVTCESVFEPVELEEYLKINSDIELPVLDFSEFSNMSANAVKSWFIDHMIQADSSNSWQDLLELSDIDYSMCEGDFIQLLRDAVDAEETTVAGCVNLNKAFKVIRSNVKSKRDGLQAAIRTLLFDDDIGRVCEVDIHELKSRIEEIDVEIQHMEKANQVYQRAENLKASISEYVHRSTAWDNEIVAEYETKSEQLQSLEDTYREAQTKYSAATDILRIYNQNHPEPVVTFCEKYNENCYKCDCDGYKKYQEVHLPKIKQLEANQRICCEFRDRATEEIHKLRNEIQGIESSYRKISSNKVKIDALQEELDALSDVPDNFKSTENLQSRKSELTSRLVSMMSNLEYTKKSDELSDVKMKLDYEISILDTLIRRTGVNDLQTKLVTEPFEHLATNIEEFSHNYAFKYGELAFNVSTKANSFSFGLNRDGTFVPYDNLSSGEKAKFSIMMQLYMIQKLNYKFDVLIIDDNFDHVDDDNFHDLMEDIGIYASKHSIQFILAGVRSLNNVHNIYTIDMEAM